MTSESWEPLDIDTPDTTSVGVPDSTVHVVAFVAAAGARSSGWAARAALEVCRGWAADGARVVLCDVNLERPELHVVAGLDNLEGVSDALLFGSSFHRIGQPISDGLFLATAGTAVPDAEGLRSHPRWRDFAGGFAQAGALLALYVPAEAAGVDALTALAEGLVLLRADHEEVGIEVSADARVLAEVGPAPGEAEVGESVGEPPEPEPEEEEEALEPLSLDQLGIDPASPDAGAGVGNALEDLDLEDSSPEIAFPSGPVPVAEGREAEIAEALVVDETAFDEPGQEAEAVEVENPFAGLEDGAEDSLAAEVFEEVAEGDPGEVPWAEPAEGWAGEAPPTDEFVEDDLPLEGDPIFETDLGLVPDESEALPTGDEAAPEELDLAPEFSDQPTDVAEEVERDEGFVAPFVDGADGASEVADFEYQAADLAGAEPPRAVESAVRVESVVPAESPSATESARPSPPPRRTPSAPARSSRSTPVGLLVLLLIVLALLVAEWMGFIEIPGITPEGGRGPGAAGAAEPTPAAEVVSEVDAAPDAATENPNPIAAYVLAMGSFTDFDNAVQRRDFLRLVLSDIQFILAPVEVAGSPYFRLLAGPARDTLELVAMRDQMNQVLTERVEAEIREASLAFLVGVQPRLNLAERLVDALDALGIPAHVLRYDEADGVASYRVYAGAYANASEASYLGRLLTEADQLNFSLTERRGVQPE